MAKSPSSDEYRSLTGGRTVKTYGTTPHSASLEFSPSVKGYIDYQVQHTDTLEVNSSSSLGDKATINRNLAKKYSTTVSDLKRKNKLWNNETLLFREKILIPIHELPTTSNNSSTDQPSTSKTSKPPHHTEKPSSLPTSSTTSNSTKPNKIPLNMTKPSHNQTDLNSNGLTKTRDEVKDQTLNEENDVSSSDFFAKFDKSFQTLSKNVKTQIDRSQELLSGATDEDVLFNSDDFTEHFKNNRRNKGKGKSIKSSKTNGGGSQSSSQSSLSLSRSSSEDIRHAPEPSFIKTKSKSAQRKLQQHELRQNELFEL